MTSNLRSECQAALAKCQIPPVTALVTYMESVLEWNEKVNITGAKNAEEFAIKHIADVWNALNAANPPRGLIYDIGSGGGIPGIVLAIMVPGLRVNLVERRQKKARVLEDLVARVGVGDRVKVICGSFEELKRLEPDAEFWFRGFLPGLKLGQYLTSFFPRANLGSLVLMKGPAWPEEKAALVGVKKMSPAWLERFASAAEIPYQLPHNAGQRLLVIV